MGFILSCTNRKLMFIYSHHLLVETYKKIRRLNKLDIPYQTHQELAKSLNCYQTRNITSFKSYGNYSKKATSASIFILMTNNIMLLRTRWKPFVWFISLSYTFYVALFDCLYQSIQHLCKF